MPRQPGLPGSQIPKGVDWLVRRMQDLEAQMQQMGAALGALTGMTFAQGAIRSATFDGDLDAPAPGATGFALGGPHDALIVNDIVLRGGIIGNEALSSPVSGDQANGVANGITYTGGTVSTRRTENIPVPAGFTIAVVMASAIAGTTFASTGTMSCLANINGVDGDLISVVQAGGEAISVPAAFASVVTGLAGGGNLPVSVKAGGTNGTAGSGNARISAIAIFLR